MKLFHTSIDQHGDDHEKNMELQGLHPLPSDDFTEGNPNRINSARSFRVKSLGVLYLLLGLFTGGTLIRFIDHLDVRNEILKLHLIDRRSDYDGPTFILHVGLEGTGHHLLKTLLKQSPVLQAIHQTGVLKHLGSIQIDFLFGLMMPYCADGEMRNPHELFINMTESLRSAKELLKDRPSVSFVPLNNAYPILGLQGDHELSYPDSPNCKRIKHPNIDLFYSACEAARVNCGAVYLYRDPYAVVRSNQNRHFNANVQQGIHLYTMMLQIIYAQLSYTPEKTLACIGLYEENAPDQERWHPIRDMYGWNDAAAFDAMINATYIEHGPLTQEEKDELVPSAYREQMRAMVSAHDKVVEQCRRIVQNNYVNTGQ